MELLSAEGIFQIFIFLLKAWTISLAGQTLCWIYLRIKAGRRFSKIQMRGKGVSPRRDDEVFGYNLMMASMLIITKVLLKNDLTVVQPFTYVTIDLNAYQSLIMFGVFVAFFWTSSVMRIADLEANARVEPFFLGIRMPVFNRIPIINSMGTVKTVVNRLGFLVLMLTCEFLQIAGS